MYVCVCHGVTDGQIKKAAQAGASSLRDLNVLFGLGEECGRCARCARDCLRAAQPGCTQGAATQTPVAEGA